MKSASAPGQASACIGEIIAAWSRGSAHTMEMAKVVLAARHRLRYGEWSKLWQSGRMPFSKRKGEMLVVIGERLGWIDAQTFAHLPVGWSVLYWLARLERKAFKELLRGGIIHPKLTLAESKRLAKNSSDRSKASATQNGNIGRRLQLFTKYVLQHLDSWSSEERRLVARELSQLVQQISDTGGSAQKFHFPDEGLMAARHPSPRNVIIQPQINA